MLNISRSLRSLRRSPGYAVSAIVSISLGLALSTATFAMVDAVLHPAPAFTESERLFRADLRFGNQKRPPTVGDQMRALRALPQVEGVVARWDARLGRLQASRQARGVQAASYNYWDVLGVKPKFGRLPLPDEARARSVAVVSQEFWNREHGRSAGLTGAAVTIGDRRFDIVAVMPSKATENYGGSVWIAGDEQAALDTLRASTYMREATIWVRLKPGESVTTVQAGLDRIAATFTKDHVSSLSPAPPYRLSLVSAVPRLPRVTELEVLFFGLAFGILAIACTNVAALTMARGLSRRRDYALRLALGASRRAIAGEVLGEVATITVIGGAIGLGFTFGLIGLFTSLIPEEVTWMWMEPPVLNARIFIWAAVAMLGAIAVAGGIPAWRASRVAPNDPLKDGAGTTTGRSRGEFRALVIGEMAVAMVLLMMASLMTLSASNVLNYDFGFDMRSLVQVQVGLPSQRTLPMKPEDRRALRDLTTEIVRATPGVQRVTLRASGGRQLQGNLMISDRTASGEPSMPLRYARPAGAGLIGTIGAKIVAGRDFVEGDAIGEGAVILSERAAKTLFPRGDALNRMVKLGNAESTAPWIPVVGITNNWIESPAENPELEDPLVLVAAKDLEPSYWTIFARVNGDPRPVVMALQRRLRDAAPRGGYVGVDRMAANLESMHRVLQFMARIFGSLATAAIALAALGLFSVLSYVVNQRSREFAVRVALGASEQNIVKVVMRSALEFALGGTAIGALLSFWASAGLSYLLFGVKNTDPASLVFTEVTLIAVCLLAALAPALRAARANPLDIIRAV